MRKTAKKNPIKKGKKAKKPKKAAASPATSFYDRPKTAGKSGQSGAAWARAAGQITKPSPKNARRQKTARDKAAGGKGKGKKVAYGRQPVANKSSGGS